MTILFSSFQVRFKLIILLVFCFNGEMSRLLMLNILLFTVDAILTVSSVVSVYFGL